MIGHEPDVPLQDDELTPRKRRTAAWPGGVTYPSARSEGFSRRQSASLAAGDFLRGLRAKYIRRIR